LAGDAGLMKRICPVQKSAKKYLPT
jgi:hypothetical protein